MGAKMYNLVNLLDDQLLTKEYAAVEIGSDRGEGSTFYLNKFFIEKNIDFYSVDFNFNIYSNVKKYMFDRCFNVTGEIFLRNIFPLFNKKINFLYLDNFDFIYKQIEEADFVKNQIAEYKKYNVEMNNYNSQKTHLIQVQESIKFLDRGSLVLFDDTFENNNQFDGKGGLAVPFLLENNFKIIMKSISDVEQWNSYVLLKKQ